MKKLISVAGICILAACSKHANDITIDTPTANVIVSEPISGAVYRTGDSVTINAIAIATAVIHGYDIAIKKGNDTTSYYFEHIHDHNDTILVNRKWKSNIGGPLKMEAELTFYLDHDGHVTIKRVPFCIQ
jgi:hypothetical protein